MVLREFLGSDLYFYSTVAQKYDWYDFGFLKFIENCFMAECVVNLGVYSLDRLKECILCV